MARGYQIACALFLLSVSASDCSAQATSEAAEGIRRVCEPLAMAFFMQSKKVKEGSEAWSRYAESWLYSDVKTLSEARNKGFRIDTTYQGSQLSSIWSDNQGKNSDARIKWEGAVKRDQAGKGFIELEEVKTDPRTVAEYNKCVDIMARSPDDVTSWFNEPLDRARALLNVAIRPRFDMPPQKVVSAPIQNGFFVPGNLDALRKSNPRVADCGADRSSDAASIRYEGSRGNIRV